MNRAPLPNFGFVCLLFATLVSSCDRRAEEEVHFDSGLSNAQEFRAMARGVDSSAAALGTFVLWLTSTSAQVAVPSCVQLSDQELSSLLPVLRTELPPRRASLLGRDGERWVVTFEDADSTTFPGGHFWLQIRIQEHQIVEADLITEPESIDQADMIAEALETQASILESGDGRTRTVSGERFVALAADLWPTIDTVRSALLDWYTPRAVEALFRRWDIRELDGQVWVLLPNREEENWEDAMPVSCTRSRAGFETVFGFPGTRRTVRVRFAVTLHGWRVD